MNNDSAVTRRDFLRTSAKTGAGLAALGGITFISQPQRVFGANDRVQVAIIGLNGRGGDHIKGFSRLANAQIAALCDVDPRVLDMRLTQMDKQGLPKPKTYADIRKLLDDKSIDAISIATPNHWHSLMAIWGCQAGKDVYVEKPCSHNWWEGKQLVEAAAKYNRVVQHGTQSRSGKGVIEGIKQINGGLIGEVYLARGLCFKWRDTIGRASEEPVPSGVDYDLWTGPAPMKPFTRNRFHYNWHWIWDTGNGDVGNQGVHEMDKARWGLGVKYPTRVSAIGGHFMFDDDQQTPNTLNTAFEFVTPDGKRKMLEFEVRHWVTNSEAMIGTKAFGSEGVPAAGFAAALPTDTKSAAAKPKTGPDAGSHNVIGNLFYGSKGYMAMGDYDSYKSWLGKEMEPGPGGHGAGDHYANFIDCVHSRKKEDLHAPIEEGHISCTLIHLANISYRLGRTIHFKPDTQEINGDKEAMDLIREGDRGYRDPYVVPERV
jgi:Oxidoreductase family, NAD-binding Rossmann fold/Oxidoreductase family, C-terminal alpha/beta domain